MASRVAVDITRVITRPSRRWFRKNSIVTAYDSKKLSKNCVRVLTVHNIKTTLNLSKKLGIGDRPRENKVRVLFPSSCCRKCAILLVFTRLAPSWTGHQGARVEYERYLGYFMSGCSELLLQQINPSIQHYMLLTVRLRRSSQGEVIRQTLSGRSSPPNHPT